jgi:hypothetical protein
MYGGDPNAAADFAREQEVERNARIKGGKQSIETAFSGFNEPFYDARRRDYLSYATPIFADEQQQAGNSLTAALARRGLLNSGAAVRAGTALQKYAGQKEREISDAAVSEENKLRSEVANQRSNLTSQLVASADPSQASAEALTRAALLRAPSTFQPIGQLFEDFTNTWRANQVASANNPGVPNYFSFGGQNPSQTLVR